MKKKLGERSLHRKGSINGCLYFVSFIVYLRMLPEAHFEGAIYHTISTFYFFIFFKAAYVSSEGMRFLMQWNNMRYRIS
jgi:hypothetical protein